MENTVESITKDTAVREMTEIGRTEKYTGERQTVYRLFRKNPGSDEFCIAVSCRGESQSGVLYGCLSDVSAIFEKIVNGEVKPYILKEILDDYANR